MSKFVGVNRLKKGSNFSSKTGTIDGWKVK